MNNGLRLVFKLINNLKIILLKFGKLILINIINILKFKILQLN